MLINKGGRFTSPIATCVTRRQTSALKQLPPAGELGKVQGVYLSLHQKTGNFIQRIGGLNNGIL